MTFIKDDFLLHSNSKSKTGSRFMRAKIIKGNADLVLKNEKTKKNDFVVGKKNKNTYKVFQNL